MGLAEQVLAVRAPDGEARELKPWGDWSPSQNTYSGARVTQSTALNLLTVYGATALIADTIATLPIDTFRRPSEGPAVEVRPPPWLERPNSEDDIVDLLVKAIVSILLDGNIYAAYTLDRSMVTQEVQILDPVKTTVRREGGRLVPYHAGQRFGGNLRHVKGIVRAGDPVGLSPVEAARQGIGVGLASQEFAGRFFGNGIHVSGVIQMDDPDPDIDKLKAMKELWMRDHSGLSRAFEPGVLWGGAKWEQLSVTPEQAQFLDTQKWNAAAVAAQIFLLDPTLLGIPVDGTSLTYANLEQRGIHLVQFTLLRWIRRIERLVGSLLPKPQFIKLNVDGLLRADLKTRYEAYRIGTAGNAFLTQNEAREKENLPLIGSDELPAPVTPSSTGGMVT